MTTDDLLERMRKAVSQYKDSSAEDDNLAELAGQMADTFEELDTLLVTGSPVPEEWAR